MPWLGGKQNTLVATDKGDILPAIIQENYDQKGNRFYRKNDDVLAFTATPEKLETPLNDTAVISHLLTMANHRGWSTIKVDGTEDFKRQVWLEATVMGLDVQGYTPSEQDKASLQSLQQQKQVTPNPVAPSTDVPEVPPPTPLTPPANTNPPESALEAKTVTSESSLEESPTLPTTTPVTSLQETVQSEIPDVPEYMDNIPFYTGDSYEPEFPVSEDMGVDAKQLQAQLAFFEKSASSREYGVTGFKDGGSKWQAIPLTQRNEIDAYIQLPKEERSMALNQLRGRLIENPRMFKEFSTDLALDKGKGR